MTVRSRVSVIGSLRTVVCLLALVTFVAQIVNATPAAVTLMPTASPSAAEPGVHYVTIIGNNFPTGTITPSGVSVTLNPVTLGAGPTMAAVVQSVTTVIGSTRRVIFQISPAQSVKVPTPYLVSIIGTTTQGASFASQNKATLTVNPPAAISLLNPSAAQPGQSVTVTINGSYTNFFSGSTQASFGAGISVGGNPIGAAGPVTVLNPTSAIAQLTIDPGANVGSRDVRVQTGVEVALLGGGFAVVGTPELLQVNPNSGHQAEQNLSVSLSGKFTHWTQGTTSADFGAGISVISLVVNSATSATAKLNIDPSASIGGRTVTVSTASETVSLTNGFTILGQLTLSVVPPVSPTFDSSQVISGNFGNGIGQTSVTIAGGASGVGQHFPSGQTQFGLSVPLRPNAENLLTVTASDEAGGTATASNLRITQLTLSNLVKAQVSAQKLTASEVQALVANGTISISNPANFNVSIFSISLSIGGSSGSGNQAAFAFPVLEPRGQLFAAGPAVTIDCQTPGKDIEQDGNTLLIPCDEGNSPWNTGLAKTKLVPFIIEVPGTGASVPGVLLIEGKIKTLKEFFNVDLELLNTSSDFTLTNVSAMLNVPDSGLSAVAPSSGAITMDDLPPNGQGTGHFVIRGDVIGVHTVTVNFGASVGGPLLSSPVPISGSASTDVEVDGPPTMNVTVEHPDSVKAGVPYALKVNITNTSSNLDALFASLEVDLAGANLIDPSTGLPSVGPTITSLGNILAGQEVSESYTVVPSDTGPIISCVASASQNISLSVVFTDSNQGCAIGTVPSQVVPPSGQPTVTVLPAANTVDVPVSASINLLFSDAIQTQTVTTNGPSATFRFVDSTGAAVPGGLVFSTLPNGSTVGIFQPNAPLATSSQYTILVSSNIYDVNGAQLASGVTASFTTEPPANADTVPPHVSLQVLPPANPTAVPQGLLLPVQVIATDNSGVVSRIDLLLDGQLVDAQVPQGPVTFLLDTSALVPGSSHLVTAVATDPAGNTAQASLNIAIVADTTPPTVSISASATVFQGQTLPIAIQASDDTRVARVDLFVDGGAAPVYTGFVAPYQTSLNTALLSSGTHQLQATATDGAGNVAQATVGFSVISVASIALSPGTITLNGTGDTQSLTVTATLTDASTTSIVSGVGFSSSNTNVAIVDSSGVVTSVAPGTATVMATFGSLPAAQVMVTDIASVPTTLALLSGNNQTGMASQPLSAPLVVKVTDANNRPVPNVTVTFEVVGGGGTLAQTMVATDSQGLCSTTLTLGPAPGANSATATVDTLAGSPVTFGATGTTSVAGLPPTATSELFNLNNLIWAPTGSMSTPRGGTTLTVLGDGSILTLGGINASTNVFPPLATGEVFNPSNGSWTPTASLSAPRAFQTQTLLPDGSVLITGGVDANGNLVATAEVYRGPPIQKTTPVLTWATPAPIAHGTPLSSAQLNATANVPGTFIYTPPAGTVLAAGSQTLSVLFTPTDTIHHTTTTATVMLTVAP